MKKILIIIFSFFCLTVQSLAVTLYEALNETYNNNKQLKQTNLMFSRVFSCFLVLSCFIVFRGERLSKNQLPITPEC